MGDIADDIINGDMCECGEWLGNGEGYPRDCADCQEDNENIKPVWDENLVGAN